jgi:hypothetical protein
VLYVVAWPLLSEADDQVFRRLRARYHPRAAELIGPHFTLVFGAPPEQEQALRSTLAGLDRRPFWFMIDRIVRSDRYLYAVPSDGAAELADLHERLDPMPPGEAFEPHIALGLFDRSAEAEQVARIVGRQHLPIRGRVEELGLLRRDGEALVTLATAPLGA